MNDMTKEQQFQYITEALKLEGFARAGEMEIFTKMHGEQKLVVDLTAGKSVYFKSGKDKITNDDDDKTLNRIYNIVLDAEDGKMPTKSEADFKPAKPEPTPTPDAVEPDAVEPDLVQKNDIEDYTKTADSLQDEGHTKYLSPNVGKNPRPKTANPFVPTTHEPAQVLPPQPYKNPSYVSSVPKELSIETIKKYINDKVTDEEAYVFLQVCRARNLNPFTGDVHLIKYDHLKPATMVVGKDAFMKRAEMHPQYDGFEAGIIVESNDEHFTIVDENRIGTFIRSNETLLGGWAKVYRKDLTHHTEISVSLSEFNTGKSSWAKMPATMIRKVALVQCLREAFPSELSGMYESSEMGVDAG